MAACGIRVRRTVVHARGVDPRGVGQWVALVQRVDASGLAAAVLTAAVRVRGAWRPPDPRLVSPRCPVLRQVGHVPPAGPRHRRCQGRARPWTGGTSPAITAAEFGTCPERAVPPPGVGLLPVTRHPARPGHRLQRDTRLRGAKHCRSSPVRRAGQEGRGRAGCPTAAPSPPSPSPSTSTAVARSAPAARHPSRSGRTTSSLRSRSSSPCSSGAPLPVSTTGACSDASAPDWGVSARRCRAGEACRRGLRS